MCLVLDVAQQIVGFDKVVAGVEVAVVLDGQARAAGLVEDAHARRIHAQPVAQRRLEGLHVDLADIVAHPFVEDDAEEAAKLLGQHRTVGDGCPCLDRASAHPR